MNLKRIFLGLFLVLILFSLCVYYSHHYESNQEYPSTSAILLYYPEGSLVSVSGTALRLNEDGFDLLDNNGRTEYKIRSSKHVNPGDNVQLIGILGPSYTIKSTKIIVETGWSYEFVLYRSALALIFLFFIFLRYWKFDFKTFEFIRLRKIRDFPNHKIRRILRRK
jgi:hypothetical protein